MNNHGITEQQPAPVQRHTRSTTQSSSVADILERVLDKGIVITGDIKINLTDVELLTIQIRLIICSVERAMEIGLDWWTTNPELQLPRPKAVRDARTGARSGRRILGPAS